MRNWQSVKLGDIADVVRGDTITRKEVSPGEIPVIAGGKTPSCYHNVWNREGKTITVSASGAYAGFVQYFDKPIFASDCSTIKVKDETRISPKFLFYMLQAMQVQIYAFQRGSGQPHVYPSQLVGLDLSIPNINEQYKTVEFLEDLLSRLEASSADLSTSKKNLENLKLSWLQSKLVSRRKEFGYIRFGDTAETKLGKMLDAKNNFGIETPYLANINVRWGYIDTDSLKTVPLTQVNREHLLLEENDLLICEGGEPGRCAIWRPKKRVEVTFQKALHRARAKPGFQIGFLQLVLEHFVKSGSANSFFTGTTIKHLPQEKLREIPVPNIPVDQQKVICDEAQVFQASVDHLTKEITFADNRLQALRRALLESAFKSQIKNEVSSV